MGNNGSCFIPSHIHDKDVGEDTDRVCVPGLGIRSDLTFSVYLSVGVVFKSAFQNVFACTL